MMNKTNIEANTPTAGPLKQNNRRYMLFILSAVIFLNYFDRQVLGILVEPIKADLQLTDTEIGLLTGFAFALFYAVFGLPFAKWADVGNRRNIISVSLASWSFMTVLCGLAGNFLSLFAARMGVGVGEAGGTPTAHSLLASSFPAEKRGKAASFLSVSGILGSFGGIIVAGYIAQLYGWRVAFIVAGLPGLILAVIIMLTIKEPRPHPKRPPFSDIFGPAVLRECRALFSNPAYTQIAFGMVAMMFWQWGTGNWFPAYLVRAYELELGEVALRFGVIAGAASVIGAVIGGIANDRLVQRTEVWRGLFPGLSSAVAAVFAVVTFTAPTLNLALVGLFVSTLAIGMTFPTIYAAFYTIAGEERRAMGVALSAFLNNMISLALGPLLIGAASDWLSSDANPAEGLRLAMLLATVALVIASACYLTAANTFRTRASSPAT